MAPVLYNFFMAHILCWNCRDFNKPQKGRLLAADLQTHKIDILDIQETKPEVLKEHILSNLSSSITHWITKSFVGNSRGILAGINTSLFSVLNV
jgi:uncharacterized Fe-S cluster-containing radical SAM superfamily protein